MCKSRIPDIPCAPPSAAHAQTLRNAADLLAKRINDIDPNEPMNAYPILEALLEIFKEILPIILPALLDLLVNRPKA